MTTTMSNAPPSRNQLHLEDCIDDERDARLRLARYKAKLYAAPQLSSPASALRLAELERRWERAKARLVEAKRAR